VAARLARQHITQSFQCLREIVTREVSRQVHNF
jgi:hypothetical protein